MQTGEVLRREVFNLLDAAKGGRLKKLKEVNKHEIVEGVTEDYMERRVQTLLSYVKQHSPYYKEHPEWTKLEDFPVMTKGDFIEHYDEVLVDCIREQGNLYRLSTSGSTGTPFTVLCDGDKMSRVNMNFISCMELNGFRMGMKRGGDTGNDCVGTSIRLGAKSVTQLEMMPKPPVERAANNPWPEWPRILKTDYGQEEAIAVFGHDPRVYQTTVTEFIADKKGNVCKAKIVKLKSQKDEKTGRMMMVPVEGTEEVIPADVVLIAAGFLGSQKYVTDAFKVALTGRTNVETKPEAYETSVPRVFTAGDMHRGQSLVVWAIREGREAARAVDESLMGYTNL